MDKFDISILNLLQKNSKITNKELAKELGLSTTPVYERVKKLEDKGLIKDYVAIVDNNMVDKKLVVYLHISLAKHARGQLLYFQDLIRQYDEVMECFLTTGKADYLVKVLVKDMQEYQSFFMNKLSSIENIANVESSFVLNEVKHETAINLK